MLIKCPDCGHDVSTKANACPNCGCTIYAEPVEKNNVNNTSNQTAQTVIPQNNVNYRAVNDTDDRTIIGFIFDRIGKMISNFFDNLFFIIFIVAAIILVIVMYGKDGSIWEFFDIIKDANNGQLQIFGFLIK